MGATKARCLPPLDTRPLTQIGVQVMRWLSKRGSAVRTLHAGVWKSSPSWLGGAAGLLALTPNLCSLHIVDECGFFQRDSALGCLSDLTCLKRLSVSLSSLTNSFMQSAASEPLRHLTALEALTLSLEIYGPSFQLSEHLTVLSQLTFLSLQGSHAGLFHNAIALKVPMLTALRHLTLAGFLDMGPATLAQFSQLQSLQLDNYFPDESLFRFASSACFPHLTCVRLEVAPHMSLMDWHRLFDSLHQLPALQALEIESSTLCGLTDHTWAFDPFLREINTAHAHDDDCPAKMRHRSHVICLVLACSHLIEFPKGPSLPAQVIFDLTHPHGNSTFHD